MEDPGRWSVQQCPGSRQLQGDLSKLAAGGGWMSLDCSTCGTIRGGDSGRGGKQERTLRETDAVSGAEQAQSQRDCCGKNLKAGNFGSTRSRTSEPEGRGRGQACVCPRAVSLPLVLMAGLVSEIGVLPCPPNGGAGSWL